MSLEETVLGRHFAYFPSNYFLFNLEYIINNKKNSDLTLRNYTAKTKRSILFREIIVVCCENHTKYSNSLFRKKMQRFLNVGLKAGGTYT